MGYLSKTKYGTSFCVEDIIAVSPNMKYFEADDWLNKNGHKIIDSMVEAGWDTILTLLQEDNIEVDKTILE